jgi:hypothetical protein
MGGRLATYEDSGKVFLWRGVPSVRGRRYPALQKLDTSSLLPATGLGRDFKLQRYRNHFVDWICGGLFWHGLRLARKEVRPVGRRIKRFLGFHVNSHGRAKND